MAVKAMPRGVHVMLRIGWLLHQRSYHVHDVLIPVFDRPLVIVSPSDMLKSVLFPLPKSLIIWHGSHGLLDAITVFETSETHSGVFFLQHLVIVHLPALLLDPRLDIFELFMCPQQGVWIVLYVRLKATLSIAFP
jgi:hypothetical protein